MSLVAEGFVKELVKVLKKGNVVVRTRVALILSNIATVKVDNVVEELLKEAEYKAVMKAFMDDVIEVRRELVYFLLNIALGASGATAMILAEKKSFIQFLLLIFE